MTGHRRLQVAALVIALIGAMTLAQPAAACTRYINSTAVTYILWNAGPATQGQAIGNTQSMELRDHGNGACSTTANTLKTASAAQMKGSTGTDFIEFGWKDLVPSSGSFQWQPYIRSYVAGDPYESSSFAPPGTCGTLAPPDAPRYRIYRDSGTWFFRMACPGSGSYTIAYLAAGITSASMATGGHVARVALYRGGGSGYISDTRGDLSWRKLVDGSWSANFGSMQCQFDNMSNTDGHANGASATGWDTTSNTVGC